MTKFLIKLKSSLKFFIILLNSNRKIENNIRDFKKFMQSVIIKKDKDYDDVFTYYQLSNICYFISLNQYKDAIIKLNIIINKIDKVLLGELLMKKRLESNIKDVGLLNVFHESEKYLIIKLLGNYTNLSSVLHRNLARSNSFI